MLDIDSSRVGEALHALEIDENAWGFKGMATVENVTPSGVRAKQKKHHASARKGVRWCLRLMSKYFSSFVIASTQHAKMQSLQSITQVDK